MKILFAPFAKPLPGNNLPNPKNYPFVERLVELLENTEHTVTQIGTSNELPIVNVKQFLKDLPFKEVCNRLQEYETFISVDSFLQHCAWLVGKRGIVLWGMSDPLIFGHSLHINLLKDRKYLRPNQFDLYYSNQYNAEAFVQPEEVVATLQTMSAVPVLAELQTTQSKASDTGSSEARESNHKPEAGIPVSRHGTQSGFIQLKA